MTKAINTFADYKNVARNLIDDLRKLRGYAQDLSLDGSVEAIDSVIAGMEADRFNVAVVGEFKRGKSTLINVLLGKDILPMDVLPTTATLNKIEYGAQPAARVEYKDGKRQDIPVEQLKDYVTKLTDTSAKKASTIKQVVVSYPIPYCENGVSIIDTPGLNDDEIMTEVTLSVLPEVDAAIMVVMATSPFSESEKNFLEKKLITSDLGKVIFGVTHVEELSPEDRPRVIENIRQRIQDHVMVKAEKVYGKDSDEYANYKRKIGKIKIYPLPTKAALKAKLADDEQALAACGFVEFEQALEKFLTVDKGLIKLGVPVSRIKTTSVEIAKAVVLKENALSMSSEEFEERKTQALAKMKEVEQDRAAEFEKIDDSAENTFRQLNDLIIDYWRHLPLVADQVIDAYPLTVDDLRGDNAETTEQALNKAVQNALADESQVQIERIQNIINESLIKEIHRLEDYEANFVSATNEIQGYFDVAKEGEYSADDSVVGVLSGLAAGYVAGLGGALGGAYSGWKKAGVSGAVLGGGTGFLATLGVAYGGGMLIATTLGTAALLNPVGLFALFIGSGLIGGGFGSSVVSWLLGDKNINIDDTRASFKKAIRQSLEKAQEEDLFSQQVREHIAQTFEAVREQIQTETDQILDNLQHQLDKLSQEAKDKELMTAEEKEKLKQMMSEVAAICERTNELEKRLVLALSE